MLFVLFSLFLGCAPDKVEGCIDADGDGWGDCEGDCDDSPTTGAAIHPGASEICDDVDNDCDALSDEDTPDNEGDGLCDELDDDDDDDGVSDEEDCAPLDPLHHSEKVYYPDLDDDGFGDESRGESFCVPPGGDYIATGQDCDDDDVMSNPDMSESCDGVDQDCDFAVDEGQLMSWYPDNDGDGYLSQDDAVEACEAPEGYHPQSFAWDCDDSDASLNRDDNDGDWYSTCNGDCDDSTFTSHSEAWEICDDGVDNDCDELIDEAGACSRFVTEGDVTLVGGDVGGEFGAVVSGVGDLDGDGLEDLFVGAYKEDSVGADAGAGYVFLGETLSTASGEIGVADTVLVGEGAGDYAGCAVVGTGDLHGDGYDDLLVGACGLSDTGGAYLIAGGETWPSEVSLPVVGLLFQGASTDGAGKALAVGDVDGDDVADLLIGAPNYYRIGDHYEYIRHGRAYLVLGATALAVMEDQSLSDAHLTLENTEFGGNAGSALAMGDIDGDGLSDLFIGASSNYGGGVVFLMNGASTVSGGAVNLYESDVYFETTESDAYLGNVISNVGDLDGDGLDDILIGEPNSPESAVVHLVLGSTARSLSGWTAISSADAKYESEQVYDVTGSAIHGRVDVDGDGHRDLLIDASAATGGVAEAGATYVVPGGDSTLLSGSWNIGAVASAKLLGVDEGGLTVGSVGGLADINGDGADEVLIGVPYHSVGGEEVGAVFLWRGGWF